MEYMSLLGFAACAPDAGFRAGLPFAAGDIVRDAIPPLLRRRSSQATQIAFSAAVAACAAANRQASALPAVFASVAGEIQTTDQLCVELMKDGGVVSPSAFHNSVQNTVAGYWSIVQQCTQAATALAAGADTFAMALLEAWCQLACHGGELLLVCYDERWPAYLAPGDGEQACAYAMVLAAGERDAAPALIAKPHVGESAFPEPWRATVNKMPILGAIPLLAAVTAGESATVALSLSAAGWQTRVSTSGRRQQPLQ